MYSKKVKIVASIAGFCCFIALKYGVSGFKYSIANGWHSSYILPSIILLVAGGLIGGIVMYRANIERKADQEKRDKMAEELAEETARHMISEIRSCNKTSPFVLYLRPFALEKAIRERRAGVGSFKMLFLDAGKINFSLLLQDYLRDSGLLLVSIGTPDNKEGAGHVITTDSLWRERFRQFAERATTIVVVPGIQSGILSEIRWLIVSGLLVNAIFFKPKGYPKADWQKMKELYEQEEDIELPDYSPKQLSFRMYSSGRCYDVLTWRTVYLRGERKRGEDQMRALLTK